MRRRPLRATGARHPRAGGAPGLRRGAGALLPALLVAGCAGPLSTLDPAGPMAASIARIWWVMLAGSTAILTLVLALVAMTFLRPSPLKGIAPRAFLLWGGLAFPVAVLAALAVYALIEGSDLAARPGEPGAVDRQAVARQWEWRFGDGDGPADAARLVIPVGRPVHVHVTSLDVVHSFWVPRLAGKIDAIPGHVTVVRIVAPVAGVYHGVCAEYCGVGHVAMPFVVEAVDEGRDADGRDGR